MYECPFAQWQSIIHTFFSWELVTMLAETLFISLFLIVMGSEAYCYNLTTSKHSTLLIVKLAH